MARRASTDWVRIVVVAAVGIALAAAVWLRRDMVASALDELRSMSAAVVVLLLALGVLERVTRADVMRRLMHPVGFGRALTIHDVGTSASKGIPLGGPLATGLRYSIARDAAIPAPTFWSALVAYGVATTFVTWLLPFGVIVVDLTRRPATTTDLAMLAVCAVVVGGSLAFWAVVLGSDRVTTWIVGRLRWASAIAVRRTPALGRHDLVEGFLAARASLREVARRPVGLLLRTALAQAVGAVILLVALRGLGVGAELGSIEFARVFFVVTLLSSFVPVPGGVGVVEAGLTGALVAAGVDAPTALAGVLVYRLLTYIAPIVFGATLYVGWRLDVRRRRSVASASTAAAVSLS